jgi:hypothetical protein
MEIGTLDTGDYSLRGLEHVIRIERKSLPDLLGWQAAGLPVLMAGDHERAGRYVARMLAITARRRWRELRALSSAVAGDDDDSTSGGN